MLTPVTFEVTFMSSSFMTIMISSITYFLTISMTSDTSLSNFCVSSHPSLQECFFGSCYQFLMTTKQVEKVEKEKVEKENCFQKKKSVKKLFPFF